MGDKVGSNDFIRERSMPVTADAETGAGTSDGSDGQVKKRCACDGQVNGSSSRRR